MSRTSRTPKKRANQKSYVPNLFVEPGGANLGTEAASTAHLASALKGALLIPVIAQLAEHLTVELCRHQMVPGSIPGDRKFYELAFRLWRYPLGGLYAPVRAGGPVLFLIAC